MYNAQSSAVPDSKSGPTAVSGGGGRPFALSCSALEVGWAEKRHKRFLPFKELPPPLPQRHPFISLQSQRSAWKNRDTSIERYASSLLYAKVDYGRWELLSDAVVAWHDAGTPQQPS